MLIGVTDATRKIAASATSTAAPPTTSGTPAATSDPKTISSASAASGREMSSLRRRSASRHRLDVAVERRPAGQLDRRARAPARRRSREDRQRRRASRRAAGRGRRCRRRCGRRPRPGAAGGACETTRATCGASGCRASPRPPRARTPASRPSSVGLREHDHQRRRRGAELGLEERLGPRRFEVVEDEAAGAQRRPGPAARAAGRAAGRAPHAPTTEPGVAHDETAEAIEGGHGRWFGPGVGSDGWPDGRHRIVAAWPGSARRGPRARSCVLASRRPPVAHGRLADP